MFYETTHFLDPFMMEEKEYLKNRLNPQIVNAWFNEKKGVTVVKWSDGTITKVTLQSGDVWNKAIGIGFCYIKKFSGNKRPFNEILRKFVYDKPNQKIDEKETLKAYEHFKDWSEKYKDIDFLNK